MEMEIIGKLQNNFQNIVNDISSEYEVVIRHKSKHIVNLYIELTLSRFNLTLKELRSSKFKYVKYKAFLFIYLHLVKGLKISEIGRHFKNTHQNVSYLINTYTDTFTVDKNLHKDYCYYKDVMNQSI